MLRDHKVYLNRHRNKPTAKTAALQVMATIKRSPRLASDPCFTSKLKLRSKVSTMHLLFVSVSNVIGVMNFVAFCVMITCTSAFSFTSIEARLAIL